MWFLLSKHAKPASDETSCIKTRYTVAGFDRICHIQRKQVMEPTHTDNSAAASLLPTIREERWEEQEEGGRGRFSDMVRHKGPELLEDCRSLYLSWIWSTARRPPPAVNTTTRQTRPRSRLSSTARCVLWRWRHNKIRQSTGGENRRRKWDMMTEVVQEKHKEAHKKKLIPLISKNVEGIKRETFLPILKIISQRNKAHQLKHGL